MKIKALKSIAGVYGFLKRGDEADITDDVAKELLAFGDIEQIDATAADVDPKKGRPDGKSKD